MKWISVAVTPASGDDVQFGNHYSVWCVSDTGELWCFVPRTNNWSKIDNPPEEEEEIAAMAENVIRGAENLL